MRFLKTLIVFLIFFFIFQFIFKNLGQLENYSFSPEWSPLFWALVLGVLSTLGNALIWQYITQKNDCALPLKKGLYAWFLAEGGKYIPGKLFLILGKMYIYQKEGRSKTRVLTSFYFETICTLIAQFFIFIPLALSHTQLQATLSLHISLPLVLLALLLSTHPRLIEWAFNLFLKLMKQKPQRLNVRYSDILKFTVLYGGNLVLQGFGFYLLVDAFFAGPMGSPLLYIAAYAAASALGMLAIFAPSGLGVREGALILILRTSVPNAIAGVISILGRIWISGIELAMIGIAYLSSKELRARYLT